MKQLEKLINICLDKNLNFSVFSLPSSSSFEIIIEHHLSCSHTKTGFIFHPYEVSSKYPEIFISADYRISSGLITDEFISTICDLSTNEKHHSSDNIVAINKTDYVSKLDSAIKDISYKNLDKFIYSRIKTVENIEGLDLSNYLFRLNEMYSSAFIYLVNHSKTGTWIGATPETLVDWNQGKLSTMSLAGTQSIKNKKPVWSDKETEEQAYVTNYIQDIFIQQNISYLSGDTTTIKAGSVYHLKTEITSKSNVDFTQAYQFVKSLHPTPAICGVPLKDAKEMITNIENHDRAYYTGYLGFIEPEKKLQLFVNLRCMQVLSNSLALYLGGGITAKSVAKKEWDETNFKAQTLLNCLP